MRVRAKIEYKFPKTSGTSEKTGNQWTAQEVKLKLLNEHGKETSETIVARCNELLIISSPMFEVGKTGMVSLWFNVDEYNGRAYQKVKLNGFEPMEFKYEDHPFDKLNEEAPSGDPQVSGDSDLLY